MDGELILIVEDNEINLKLFREVLQIHGYRTAEARDGLKGVELACQLRPRLVLMDLHLPGMNGLEATRRLKANPQTRDILVYAFTALAMKGDEEKAREAGCDGYITKPIDLTELIRRVKEALSLDPARGPGKTENEERQMKKGEKARVLVVDDEEVNRKLLGELVGICGYEFQTATNGIEALEKAKAFHPDIILLDVMMPGMNGYEVCRRLKADPQTQMVTVVMITALTDRDSKLEGLGAGASDFLNKPVDQVELATRLQNLLKVKELQDFLQDHNRILEEQVTERTSQLQDAIQQLDQAHQRVKLGYIGTVHRLTVASEYRDEDTGAHIKRISHYSQALAGYLGFPEPGVEAIFYASPMHDVGKIGIPDEILLKPGRHTPEEFEIMKTHTTIGATILSGSESEFLRMAELIALNHHERWDGTGYPNGLKRADIPIEAQIVNIVDQYDALRSKRPYKPAFDHPTTYKILIEGDGKTMPHHFNPDILQAFKECALELEGIFETV